VRREGKGCLVYMERPSLICRGCEPCEPWLVRIPKLDVGGRNRDDKGLIVNRGGFGGRALDRPFEMFIRKLGRAQENTILYR
jgi:hypothetical protein